MRADRLLRMTFLLQKHKQMTAQDLADELEVSLSTIYRDIDALGIAGIPVYTQPGTNGGIFIEEGFRATLTDLSQAQILSLFLAINAKSLADIGLEQTTKDAVLKVFNTLPASHQDEVRRTQQRLYIDSEGWFSNSENPSQYLEIVQQAVWQDKRLKLVYQSYESSPYDLVIDAYALVSKSDKWYLVGRKDTGDYRTYRLTRIIQLQLFDEKFARDSSFNLATYWKDARQYFDQQMAEEFPDFTVELRVHSTTFWYLVRVLDGQFEQISPPDETHMCYVRVRFRTEQEARAHILSMATGVEIISPIYLVDDIRQIVKEMGEYYRQ